MLLIWKQMGSFFIKYIKWFQLPDTATLPLRRWLFPSYEGCDISQHWKTNRLTSTNLQYYYVFLPAAYEMQSELLEANYISYTILLTWKPSYKFLNRLVLLNLYVRDTDSRCKNTNFIINKQIMLVKFLMLFCKNQHFLRWFWTKSDKSLIERKFSVFPYLLRRDSENWFKLVHFILTLFFLLFI